MMCSSASQLTIIHALVLIASLWARLKVEANMEFEISEFTRDYQTKYAANLMDVDKDSIKIGEDDLEVLIHVDGKETSLLFQLGGGGMLAASSLSLYENTCRFRNVLNQECPQVLRKATAERYVAKSVNILCDSLFPSSQSDNAMNESLDKSRCHAEGSRLFSDAAHRIIRSTDEHLKQMTSSAADTDINQNEIGAIRLPTFLMFEQNHYADLCNNLSKLAYHHLHASKEEQTTPQFGKNYEHVEGSIWLSSDALEREQFVNSMAWLDASPRNTSTWHYLEVGFNAGHSAAIILSMFPNAIVSSFDMCQHAYTVPNAKYLGDLFPGRFHLYCGDSRKSLQEYERDQEAKVGNRLADVVRVDGGHRFPVAAADIMNGKKLGREGALLLVDDCEDIEVYAAWEFAVELKAVKPLYPGLGWKGSCVGRYS